MGNRLNSEGGIWPKVFVTTHISLLRKKKRHWIHPSLSFPLSFHSKYLNIFAPDPRFTAGLLVARLPRDPQAEVQFLLHFLVFFFLFFWRYLSHNCLRVLSLCMWVWKHTPSISKQLPANPWKKHDDKLMISPPANNEARLAQSVRRLYAERVAVGRFSLLLFLFISRMRSACTEHAYLTSYSWYHTSYDAQIYNLEFDPGGFLRPWLPPWGTESWPARTPWVLGFFSGGGNRLCSEGEPVQVLSKKGKRTAWNSLTVLAAIPKENYLLDPCVDF